MVNSTEVQRHRDKRKCKEIENSILQSDAFAHFFIFFLLVQSFCSGICEPRNVVLHRAKRGFGFVLRGAKAASPLMQLKPSDRCPGLQYLDDVDPGGVADMAGLSPGDFLMAVS